MFSEHEKKKSKIISQLWKDISGANGWICPPHELSHVFFAIPACHGELGSSEHSFEKTKKPLEDFINKNNLEDSLFVKKNIHQNNKYAPNNLELVVKSNSYDELLEFSSDFKEEYQKSFRNAISETILNAHPQQVVDMMGFDVFKYRRENNLSLEENSNDFVFSLMAKEEGREDLGQILGEYIEIKQSFNSFHEVINHLIKESKKNEGLDYIYNRLKLKNPALNSHIETLEEPKSIISEQNKNPLDGSGKHQIS